MLMYLNAEDISSDISLPRKGWETVIWYRSRSDISDDVYYHLIRIFRVKNVKQKPLFQAHLQMFRNNAIRKYDILDEISELY